MIDKERLLALGTVVRVPLRYNIGSRPLLLEWAAMLHAWM